MKTATALMIIGTAFIATAFVTEVNAQRGEQRNRSQREEGARAARGDHDRHNHDRHDHKDYHRDNSRSWSYDRNDRHRHSNSHAHHGSRRVIVHHHPGYTHYHSPSCSHHRVVRRMERPRYIFYNDYNTYYDLTRNVYIVWSGHGWTMTSALPAHLHRVDLRHAVCHEVDYYDDDFIDYVGQGRPTYGRVYVYR